jgi:hypothetical protein
VSHQEETEMTELAAALGVFGATIITVLVEKLRRDNKRDHAVVEGMLKNINRDVHEVKVDVKDVSGRLADHIEWHATSEAPKKRGRPPKKAAGA